MAIAAGLLGLGLVAVNVAWPAAFGVFIAIGGVIGAIVVLYEVRLTKRIAQAEFIRDLQSGFASDQNICDLWRKLLLHEEITMADRPMVSSYLTFFETLHLLLSRGALELQLTDNLFRNRFFTAIGDKGVLDTALIRHAGAFSNIHNLITTWHDYLLTNGFPIHPGYYSYVRAITEAKGYDVVRLDPTDLPALEHLQTRVLESLGDDSVLRANTGQMLKECLADHVTLGIVESGELVAAAILYDAGTSGESIRGYLTSDPVDRGHSINLKLVLVLPGHRRGGLARALIELLEHEAAERRKDEIMCTIHPRNTASKSLFTSLGYERVGRVDTEYGRRDVYGRALPPLSARWAR